MQRQRDSVAYLLQEAGRAVQALDQMEIERFLRILLDGGRVFAYGVGRSSMIIRAFAMRLNHMAFTVYTIGETITPAVHDSDVVVLLSGSGTTDMVVKTAHTIGTEIGAIILSVTANPDSDLVKLAKQALVIPITEHDPKLAPLGTLFEFSSWLLFDTLVARLMQLRGDTEERMSQRHSSLF